MSVQEMTETDQVLYRGYKLTCYNPFGFWKIANEEGRGLVPKEISGDYTSSHDAQQGIDSYLNRLEQEAKQKDHVEKQVVKNKEKADKAEQAKNEAQIKEKLLSGSKE